MCGSIRLTCFNMFLPNAFRADGLLIIKATKPVPGELQAGTRAGKANYTQNFKCNTAAYKRELMRSMSQVQLMC